ncbi:MAG: hypothetical protein RJB62_1508 [Pseudomonadota bacterium]|jgi:ribonuclease E
MSKRMLIDSSHPEETRVVVLDGNKVDEFDFESASRRPLKGNIYLAKITRVEPSLQAAFVEYGGNRQGFLAFSEIHPDYYQIPVADRMALLADQSRRLMAEDDDLDGVTPAPASLTEKTDGESSGEMLASEGSESGDYTGSGSASESDEHADHDHAHDHDHDHSHDHGHDETHDHTAEENDEDEDASPSEGDDESDSDEDGETDSSGESQGLDENAAAPAPSEVLTENTGAPAQRDNRRRSARPPRRRQYKIQEVIRRKQIILVQVVKEERGNKGASLTTYLSLAGRYCVLMPNTPRGGGISRKITSATDRKRLKSAAQSLELPEGMGLIIRTAGANRTKVEIKRDYEYLLRLWDSVRELTLKSNAPSLVYEEGNLIKRAIRDLYGKDISEVIVDGDAGYRDAKDFMRMLMPSHAKNVKPYKDTLPLFQSYHVEAQLDAMFSPVVTLKSGGYIVINQTEALVSIDVNSGKATREHSIEDTAYKTNLEAADEVARQMRLRDLAGLIVIDFIDMEDGKNDRNVEKRIRDALRDDRARIQIGKISQFGLLEMSRQRLRAGVLAGSTVACPHCEGLGYIRSTESAALRLLRSLDDEGQQLTVASVLVRAPSKIAIYTLNHKRAEILRIEQTYDMVVLFETKDDMSGGSFEIERTGTRSAVRPPKQIAVTPEIVMEDEPEEAEDIVEAEDDTEQTQQTQRPAAAASSETQRPQAEDANGRKRKRRRRRGGRGRNAQTYGENVSGVAMSGGSSDANAEIRTDTTANAADDQDGHEDGEQENLGGVAGEEGGKRRRRRRGRRGRRRDNDTGMEAPRDASSSDVPQTLPEGGDEPEAQSIAALGIAPNAPSAPQWSLDDSKPAENPAERGDTQLAAPKSTSASETTETETSGENRKGGWWQRRFGI